jgi:hypothetical protein
MNTEDLLFRIEVAGSERRLMLEPLIDGKLFEWYERERSGHWVPTGVQAATFQEALLRAVEDWGEVRVGRETTGR